MIVHIAGGNLPMLHYNDYQLLLYLTERKMYKDYLTHLTNNAIFRQHMRVDSVFCYHNKLVYIIRYDFAWTKVA